jgi:hypothetical protein
MPRSCIDQGGHESAYRVMGHNRPCGAIIHFESVLLPVQKSPSTVEQYTKNSTLHPVFSDNRLIFVAHGVKVHPLGIVNASLVLVTHFVKIHLIWVPNTAFIFVSNIIEVNLIRAVDASLVFVAHSFDIGVD